MQQQLQELQQQVAESKPQAADQQKQQQEAFNMAVQQMQEQYSSVIVSLQVRQMLHAKVHYPRCQGYMLT